MCLWTDVGCFRQAIIDSGTSFLVATYEDYFTLGKLFNMTVDLGWSNETYYISCNETWYLPNITFELGSKDTHTSLMLTPWDYVREDGIGSNNCTIQISCCDDLWIMGDTFMRRWYSIFDMDNKRMGFAQSVW